MLRLSTRVLNNWSGAALLYPEQGLAVAAIWVQRVAEVARVIRQVGKLHPFGGIVGSIAV